MTYQPLCFTIRIRILGSFASFTPNLRTTKTIIFPNSFFWTILCRWICKRFDLHCWAIAIEFNKECFFSSVRDPLTFRIRLSHFGLFTFAPHHIFELRTRIAINRNSRIGLCTCVLLDSPNSEVRMAINRSRGSSFSLALFSTLRTPNSEWISIAFADWDFYLRSSRINLDRCFLFSLHRNRPSGLNLCTFHWSLISGCCMLCVCVCVLNLY